MNVEEALIQAASTKTPSGTAGTVWDAMEEYRDTARVLAGEVERLRGEAGVPDRPFIQEKGTDPPPHPPALNGVPDNLCHNIETTHQITPITSGPEKTPRTETTYACVQCGFTGWLGYTPTYRTTCPKCLGHVVKPEVTDETATQTSDPLAICACGHIRAAHNRRGVCEIRGCHCYDFSLAAK